MEERKLVNHEREKQELCKEILIYNSTVCSNLCRKSICVGRTGTGKNVLVDKTGEGSNKKA